MDATPAKTEHDRSATLQCAHCNAVLPSFARFCGICGESLRANIGEDDTIPRLSRLRTSGVDQYTSHTRVSLGLLWSWQVIIVLSAVAAALVAFVFSDSPLRPVFVMWFLFMCPGMMLVRFLRLNQPVVEWVLALALSLAIDAIVAGVVLYVGKWSPAAILGISIGLCLAGVITQLAISNRKSA
jgi:hypothetical protein